MLQLKKQSSKLRLLGVGIIIILAVVVVSYYATSIYRYSLTVVTSSGSPMAEAPREREGCVYSLPIELSPKSRLPVTIQSVEVFDGKTGQTLDLAVFMHDYESQLSRRAYIISGYTTLTEWFEQYADRIHSPYNFKIKSQHMWLVLLFEKLPAQDHGVRVVISYKLYDVFQKQEEILLNWDE